MASKEHEQWYSYLQDERLLTPAVIKEAGLSVKGDRLVIPIKDCVGNTIFNKYRRAPWGNDSEPKYKYDYGSKATLYGTHFQPLPDADTFVVEGEFDVLAMRSLGYNSYSGTGGAGTWREEWNGLLPDNPVIMYDNDETGIRGAINLALSLKKCRFAWVPTGYGKDASDLLVNKPDYIFDKVIEIDIPAKGLVAYSKKLSQQCQDLPEGVGRSFLSGLAKAVKPEKKKFKAPMASGDDRITRAKAYPVEHLLKVTRRKAVCPFHNERTPSLHVYKDNSTFCFGACNKAYDAINIYQKLNECSFIEALDNLAPRYE